MLRNAVFAIAALLLGLRLTEAGPSSPFKIIVNPKVSGSTMSRQIVAAVYLGKAERWGNGTPIKAFDLSAMSPVRAAFSEAMLGQPTMAVRRYWEQRLMAGGGSPPMVKPSEEAVIAAVAADEGAIAYVSEETPVPETVKVILVQ